jgi:hypothetical protein
VVHWMGKAYAGDPVFLHDRSRLWPQKQCLEGPMQAEELIPFLLEVS